MSLTESVAALESELAALKRSLMEEKEIVSSLVSESTKLEAQLAEARAEVEKLRGLLSVLNDQIADDIRATQFFDSSLLAALAAALGETTGEEA